MDSGIPVRVDPLLPKGTVFFFNRNIPDKAYLACRALEELAEWMAKNRLCVVMKNVGEPE